MFNLINYIACIIVILQKIIDIFLLNLSKRAEIDK